MSRDWDSKEWDRMQARIADEREHQQRIRKADEFKADQKARRREQDAKDERRREDRRS